MASNSHHGIKLVDLLESANGLTFRKTFTPKQCRPPEPPQQKVLFSRLCDLFGKDPTAMKQVFEADDAENPARAAADVLGYNYKEEEDEHPTLEEDAQQTEIKDRLMIEIKEKISERRRKVSILSKALHCFVFLGMFPVGHLRNCVSNKSEVSLTVYLIRSKHFPTRT